MQITRVITEAIEIVLELDLAARGASEAVAELEIISSTIRVARMVLIHIL